MSSCNNNKDIRVGLCHKCDKVTLFMGDTSLKLDTDNFLKHAKVVKIAEERILAMREKLKKEEKRKEKKPRDNSFLSLLKA
ncbi:hypothetical protein OAK75_01580 [Bacteriovoracales bacterium]|nr:hypothetical protein [Bacteriovoracales bacterium]